MVIPAQNKCRNKNQSHNLIIEIKFLKLDFFLKNTPASGQASGGSSFFDPAPNCLIFSARLMRFP